MKEICAFDFYFMTFFSFERGMKKERESVGVKKIYGQIRLLNAASHGNPYCGISILWEGVIEESYILCL